MYFLAFKLHKSIDEILEMDAVEYATWAQLIPKFLKSEGVKIGK